MDIVTDLSSYAVSYLAILRDLYGDNALKYRDDPSRKQLDAIFNGNDNDFSIITYKIDQIKEIIYYRTDSLPANKDLLSAFVNVSIKLKDWLSKANMESQHIKWTGIDCILSYSFEELRRHIHVILYLKPDERLNLVRILNYVPILCVQCFAKRHVEPITLRMFQIIEPELLERLNIISNADSIKISVWWHSFEGDVERREYLKTLLENSSKLKEGLIKKEIPFPFVMVLNDELEEISESRKMRKADDEIRVVEDTPPAEPTTFTEAKPRPPENPPADDPILQAEQMELVGLAFSGGGIRSATFNLGIIQRLAEMKVLNRVDYLSTVSGGGYIGAWLISWIKRVGSLKSVTNNLDAKKAPNPMADEMLPIRWLRMFSNYLAPNTSAMSTDTWTMAITWVRNTLINQTILILLLCTALSFVEFFYIVWVEISKLPWSASLINTACILILISGAILAGTGMRAFDQEFSPRSVLRYGRNAHFSKILIFWAISSAFVVSALIYNLSDTNSAFGSKILAISVCTAVACACIVFVAVFGKYHKYPRLNESRRGITIVVAFSVIAAAISSFLLVGLWEIFEIVREASGEGQYISGSAPFWVWLNRNIDIHFFPFLIGLPLILEAFCVCVVVRMALMGLFFPDERREWWGRLGAIVHRWIVLWLLVIFCVFALPVMANKLSFSSLIQLAGGWTVIVGYAVRVAFSSSTGAENKERSGLNVKEIFLRVAPYLFLIGFLLIGSSVYTYFKNIRFWSLAANALSSLWVSMVGYGEEISRLEISPLLPLSEWISDLSGNPLLATVINFTLLGCLTGLLSQQVGVNEFSLHHFYRNRLVRAYLGATRRRAARVKTSNSFTGFDSKDDQNLSEFKREDRYIGPFPLINVALNATVVTEMDRQDRMAESFVFTPLYSGFDFSVARSAAAAVNGIYNYGYRPTKSFAGGPTLGTAMAISGAAVNPNMGHHSSSMTAFLLTVFNVRLGWWLGNPRTSKWKNPEPFFGLNYIIYDLVGRSNIDSNYICLSDGGHFDNMGVYELVRRRCKLIVLSDAEEDLNGTCEGLANSIRRCRIDFGVEISIDLNSLMHINCDSEKPQSHYAVGKIKYQSFTGILIYIKSSVTGSESADIREYKLKNDKFPQQSTSDQFFTEEQFESYRRLGYESIDPNAYPWKDLREYFR